MNYRRISPVASCIGCGCHDLRACEGGCWWLRVDYAAGAGVCSGCESHAARWDAGDRSTQPGGHGALLNIRQQDPEARGENA